VDFEEKLPIVTAEENYSNRRNSIKVNGENYYVYAAIDVEKLLDY